MTIEDHTLTLMHHLNDVGLIGPKAIKYGGPDELVLLSGGPASHLSRHSLLCGPSRRRLVVRQPKIEAAPSHRPSKGEIHLANQTKQLVGHIEEWKHGCWYHATSIFAENLAELMKKLKPFSEPTTFEGQLKQEIPRHPFWAGALAYDLVQWTQPLALQYPPQQDEILCILLFVERFVCEEKATGMIQAYALEGDEWADEVLKHTGKRPSLVGPLAINPHPETSSMDDQEHRVGIETIRESIAAGQMYQVNLGRWWEGKLNEHPRTIFERLAHNNPAPFSAYLQCEDLGLSLVSSSPESLLQCDGRLLSTAPIKGTRPRGATPEQEVALRNEMLNDEKERAEHRMLVDLMRNDLGAVCQIGGVEITRFDVEAYANVQHLVTQVVGEMTQEMTLSDALQSVFPGGSITGCPRTVVCATIDELEKRPRSFWTGSIGWFDPFSGAGAWNILIRTLIATRTRKQWHGAIAAGGGITIGSAAEAEVEEAKWKAAALRKACGWNTDEDAPLPIGRLETHNLALEPAPTFVAEGAVVPDAPNLELEGCVVLIDNLDSFTQNIAHAVAGLGHTVVVHQARTSNEDRTPVGQVFQSMLERLHPTHIILGPGPGRPSDSPLSMEVANRAASGGVGIPILGVCLGHQALGVAAGMDLIQTPSGPVHGSPKLVTHQEKFLFEGLKSPHPFTLYNSLILRRNGGHSIQEIAHREGAEDIMAIMIPEAKAYGVQFHPESVGSPEGVQVLANFLKIEADA